MLKIILKIVLAPVAVFCILIQLLSRITALACGWIFRILGILTLIVVIYCKVVNWTTDQQYLISLTIMGILFIASPVVLGVLAGLAEGIREAIRIATS